MKRQLDLGCNRGERAREGYDYTGVDHRPPPETVADAVVELGFAELPYPDQTFDLVTAYDFFEHLPKVVWFQQRGRWRSVAPVIQAWNEVYRVLKKGGTFDISVPGADLSLQAAERDPTHVSTWVAESLEYFRGTEEHHGRAYGHRGRWLVHVKETTETHHHWVLVRR